ncbi:MAG: phage holin family protein [Candidatus Sericytochromatia bacterium]
MKSPASQQVTEMLFVVGFAMYGAVAHTLMANRASDKRGWALTGLLAMNTIIAGFAGLMGLLLAKRIGLGAYEMYMLTGMAGFMGGKFLEVLELSLTRRFQDGSGKP